jgi:hypothetical protein
MGWMAVSQKIYGWRLLTSPEKKTAAPVMRNSRKLSSMLSVPSLDIDCCWATDT